MNLKKHERQIVFDKYGGRCAYCGCELQKGWHADHLEPCRRLKKWVNGRWIDDGFSNPGANHIDNLNPSCPSCNINKHSDDIETFRERIKKFVSSLNNYSVQYTVAKKYGLITETNNPVVFYFETL